MRLDDKSPIPLYYQLENLIRTKIDAGEYKTGEKIPSERNLSDELHLSRMTIRKAIDNLVKEGILEKKRGQGTFVSEDKLENSQGLVSFTESFKSQGKKTSNQILKQELIEVTEDISKELNLTKGERVILVIRLRLADDEIIGLEESYIPYALCPKILDIDLSDESIYGILRGEGHKPNKAVDHIQAVLADEYLSQILKIDKGRPILKNARVTFSYERPINFGVTYYRGDKFIMRTNSYDCCLK